MRGQLACPVLRGARASNGPRLLDQRSRRVTIAVRQCEGHSSGGKERLGHITRQGDNYLRTLLVHGARSYLRFVEKRPGRKGAWARNLKERRHVNIVAVALAAKNARIAWALLAHGTEYRQADPETLAA